MSDFRVDGIAVVASDAEATAERWISLLGAERAEVAIEPALGCQRIALRLGNGIVDILSPTGPGTIEQAHAARGNHLFATAVASPVATRVISDRARENAIRLTDGGLLLTPEGIGIGNAYVIVRESEHRENVGNLGTWYESTLLVDDVDASALALAETLSLNKELFRQIVSPEFSYDGILTMFRPGELSRLEVVRPWEQDSTMNRFYARNGHSLYLGFAECEELAAMATTLTSMGLEFVEIRKQQKLQQIFVPPAALGGIMLGLAYPDEAWNWSRGELAGRLT